MASAAPAATRRRRQYAEKRDFLRDYKAARGCALCGESDPIVLELDHDDPRTKNPRMKSAGQNVPWANLGWDDIHIELSKCSVLCANCHRRRHHAEKG